MIDWAALAEDLVRTTLSSEVILQRHGALGVDEDELEEKMLDHGIERCSQCGWWVDSSEVIDEDGDIVPCGACS